MKRSVLTYIMRVLRFVPRRGWRHAICIAMGLLGFTAVANERDAAASFQLPTLETTENGAQSAEFSLLTYNIAGLPAFLSQSEPEKNIPIIGELINLHDLVLVQEDFAYHRELAAKAMHPHRSSPLWPSLRVGIGDGLSQFSRLPFMGFYRTAWQQCFGRWSNAGDCWTKKGFTVAEHRIGRGLTVDVYNLHMDAGFGEGDAAVRRAQADQLADFMARRSADRAVIVAGDTNFGPEDDGVFQRLLRRTGLRDACTELRCGLPHLLDRVLYRSSALLNLEAVRFRLDKRFVRSDGSDLSDHKPVAVVFRWEARSSG